MGRQSVHNASPGRRISFAAHLLWAVPLTGWFLNIALVSFTFFQNADTLVIVGGTLATGPIVTIGWFAATAWLFLLAVFGFIGLVSGALPLGVSIPSFIGGTIFGILGVLVGLCILFVSMMHAPTYEPLDELERPWTDEIVVEHFRGGQFTVWHGGPIIYEHVADGTCDYLDPEAPPCPEVQQTGDGDFLVTPNERIRLP